MRMTGRWQVAPCPLLGPLTGDGQPRLRGAGHVLRSSRPQPSVGLIAQPVDHPGEFDRRLSQQCCDPPLFKDWVGIGKDRRIHGNND